ncbi:inactive tyrosine-protein kinase 7-like [Carcharodon carcharias]|uniref:inactive tyrosine-protein kinase 7-like n=1 Tax=Carcharodon carcharias TaxID=13397 RepID=UPI001B7E9434|nr:inactive tyrosine-protein kinase 7-like [Carcharodon carcharias]
MYFLELAYGASMAKRTAAVLGATALLAQVYYVQAIILFTKEPYSQDALHGRSAILRCEVEIPMNIVFEWLLNGKPVKTSERRFIEGSNLQFTAVDRKEDSGDFQCIARNTVSGEEAKTATASFNIKWIETGGVILKDPPSMSEIQTSAPITLRCNIDGHPRPNWQWFRDSIQLTDASHYTFNNKERSLTLKSASPDDNGVYYCCARNAVGNVCSNDNFTLMIIDASFPQPIIRPQDQIVNKKEDAMFHCQFTATPPPKQEWFFDNSIINNSSRTIVFANGSLLLTNVKPRSFGVYRCVGRGPRGKPTVLEAALRMAEIDDMLVFSPKIFIANTTQHVECPPPRGLPLPVVSWYRGSTPVPTVGRVYQAGNELIFNETAEADSGFYTCHARNKAGEKTRELSITVATIPEWVVKPTDSQLDEGKPGFLHCSTRATPTPTVTWFRNNVDISGDSRFEEFDNGTLRINNVEVYDGTLYKCQSSTPAGVIVGYARVQVLEKLKFTPPPQPQQCMELNKDMTIQCSATGREKPVIKWSKSDGSRISPHVRQEAGLLHFTKVTKSDAGYYACIASNSQGEIRAPVRLIVAVLPKFKMEPENTTVYQGYVAVLNCQATGEPQPNIHWKVKEKILDSNKVTHRVQKVANGSLVIYDVSAEDSGKYTCIAGNNCNIQHRDAFLYVVDKPAILEENENQHTPYKMIQTIGLSVGAAVAYIIIVLGLMFYCKKRRKAKRLHKGVEGEEPEMEVLNGGTLQQNGQLTAEIQEEASINNISMTVMSNKRHSMHDKLHFPRSNLKAITTLGKGEYGEVFLAKAKGIDKSEVEMVVLVKSLTTRDEQLQLEFRREFEMFSKMNHNNVVRLLGLCREMEPHYMITEYVDLGDLKQFLHIAKGKEEKIKSQPLSTKQKVGICIQVALGMECLSNHRFVHKDLAARNCLISAQRQVKVAALGLRKDVYNSEYYHFHQAWIPLRWMPAEAIFEDDFSTKSDVWSFGVLMWEVFSQGELPFSKLSDDEVLTGIQNSQIKHSAPDGCPSKLYKLMQHCWAASPKDRPSFSEIVNALGEIPADSKV